MGKGRRKASKKVPRLPDTPRAAPAEGSVTTLGELLARRGASLRPRKDEEGGRASAGEASTRAKRPRGPAPSEAVEAVPPPEEPARANDPRPVLENPDDIMAAAFDELAAGVSAIDKFEGRGQELKRVRIRESRRSPSEKEPLTLSRDEALDFDFRRAMQGVERLDTTKSRVPGKVARPGPAAAPPVPRSVAPEPFLAAWPPMERDQHDLLQEVRGLSQLPTLDLHGLRRDPALARLAGFVSRMRAEGALLVLVVCGKGLHSPGAPVLREEVLRWVLQPGHRDVRLWAPHLDKDGHWGSLYLRLHSWKTR